MYEYNLGQRFRRIANLHADRIALWFEANRLQTFGELDAASDQVAAWLIDREVRPGDVLAIGGDKEEATFAAILAAVKIGVTYVVIDPDSPPGRLHKILDTCRPRMVIGNTRLLGCVEAITQGSGVLTASTAAVAEAAAVTGGRAISPTARAVPADTPAYIMFTSGSTGVPKGAVMTHANVLNLIDWGQATYGIAPGDVLTNVNALYFDNAVFDLYGALFNGATLVPFSADEVRDPERVVKKVDRAKCTQWFSVPSLLIFLQAMKAADGTHLRSIRRFIFGGEGYPKPKLKQLFDAYGGHADLFNVYGPTECTCICSSHRITADDFRRMDDLPPLGEIAENFAFLVLDDELRPVAAGAPGELCLLGPNVGLGYFNDPERTAGSFVQNPLNRQFRQTMYRTGDVVWVDPVSGALHIGGRKDNQIKHMGYRIELEDVESAFHSLPYVSEAMVFHASVRGISRLAAVLVITTPVTDEAIRADLQRLIPDYMIPGTVFRETALPKNANGKIDRPGIRNRFMTRIT